MLLERNPDSLLAFFENYHRSNGRHLFTGYWIGNMVFVACLSGVLWIGSIQSFRRHCMRDR